LLAGKQVSVSQQAAKTTCGPWLVPTQRKNFKLGGGCEEESLMTTSADPGSVVGQVKMRSSFAASSPTMLPSPAPGEFAVVLEMGQPFGQLGYARVGPLVRAAKLRGRYRNPANAPLFFTAVFNVAVVGSLGANVMHPPVSTLLSE
jgi:hypothetical protein